MNSEEKYLFNKYGLIIDQDRVLTYSQLSCPFGCRYCFVENINFNQIPNTAYLTSKQQELMSQLPPEITLIMLGCDTEFFQSKNSSLKILNQLCALNKDISVITKIALPENFLKQLKDIYLKLNTQGNILCFSISIPCLNSAIQWEPKTPHPASRIHTLQQAHLSGLKTLVALRPLLPNISEEELEEIIYLTKDYCIGYYSGPLYLKEIDDSLIDIKDPELKIERLQPHWMPSGNIFYKVEKGRQFNLLKAILKKYNKPLFDGAAEGIKYIKLHEKY